MKLSLLVIIIALASGIPTARAKVCENANGVPTDVSYDLSGVFNSSNNQVGAVVSLSKSGYIGVQAICPEGTNQTSTLRSYVTDLPVTSTEDGFQYLRLNEYLDGAMQITDDAAGVFYPPVNHVKMGITTAISTHQNFEVRDSQLVFRLKVTRRFIDMVVIPRQTLFRVYVTTMRSDPLTSVVYTISYSGIVEVPQNCEINAGEMVEVDFGSIRASLFKDAGAGNRPEGVMPQKKAIYIKCSNIEAQALLTLRLETEKSSGHIMVSSNPDVGFIISDSTGKPFTPNDPTSVFPFRLDNGSSAETGINAWPVSVTGRKPERGNAVARGYLRVDFQ